MKRALKVIGLVVLTLLMLGGATIYSWTFTPHGRVDAEVGIMLKVMPAKIPPLAEQRRLYRKMMLRTQGDPEPLAHVKDRHIPGPGGRVPVRIYRSGSGPNPILLFYHGGAFSMGDLDTHDRVARLLAKRADVVVVSVSYRLAPENPYPAAVEDCYAALLWAAKNAATIGGDATRIAVMGDSSGGNLAAVIALKARDEKGPRIAYQLLVYPRTNFSAYDTRSHKLFQQGYGLNRQLAVLSAGRYLPKPEQRKNPYASPLLAPSLRGLPSTLIITAAFDPLRDEGEEYGRKLAAAGVEVKTSRYDGVVHGFFGQRMVRKGDIALDEAAAALKTVLR